MAAAAGGKLNYTAPRDIFAPPRKLKAEQVPGDMASWTIAELRDNLRAGRPYADLDYNAEYEFMPLLFDWVKGTAELVERSFEYKTTWRIWQDENTSDHNHRISVRYEMPEQMAAMGITAPEPKPKMPPNPPAA